MDDIHTELLRRRRIFRFLAEEGEHGRAAEQEQYVDEIYEDGLIVQSNEVTELEDMTWNESDTAQKRKANPRRCSSSRNTLQQIEHLPFKRLSKSLSIANGRNTWPVAEGSSALGAYDSSGVSAKMDDNQGALGETDPRESSRAETETEHRHHRVVCPPQCPGHGLSFLRHRLRRLSAGKPDTCAELEVVASVLENSQNLASQAASGYAAAHEPVPRIWESPTTSVGEGEELFDRHQPHQPVSAKSKGTTPPRQNHRVQVVLETGSHKDRRHSA